MSAIPAPPPQIRGDAGGGSLVEVSAVGRSYGEGGATCVALEGITLAIAPREFVALVGPSGSGKSTLLNVIGGLDRPTAGTVRFEGRDIAGLSDADASDLRLSRIGFVFQDSRLVPVLSVAENIELPLLFRRDISRAARAQRLDAALADVGLWSQRNRRPHELSGGERQRAALARALAGEPAIVLADEPTASLDQRAGAAVIVLLRSLGARHGTAILCATHDPQLVRSADAVVRLRDGRLEGSP